MFCLCLQCLIGRGGTIEEEEEETEGEPAVEQICMYIFLLSIFDYPFVMCKIFCVLCFIFRIWYFRCFCSCVCLFKNIHLTGFEKERTVEIGSYESIRIGFKGKEGGLAAVALVITIAKITVCALLFAVIFDLFASLFGAVLQTFIIDTNGSAQHRLFL